MLKSSNNFQSQKFSVKQRKRFPAFSNISEIEYNQINLINCTSVKYEDVEFINFLQQDGSLQQKQLLEELKSVIEKPTKYLDKNYEAKELEDRKQETDRILDIINRQGTKKISSITELIKLKNKKEPRFQIYIKSEADVLNVYLIDLYHLGLPGDLHKKGKTLNYNRHAIYVKRNKPTTNVCISNYLKKTD